MVRRRVIVHGEVQGVGFRYTARLEAGRIGVAGWVRNRRDGAVEAEIEGDEASVGQMIEWLAQGPPGAVVRRTDVTELEPIGESEFRVTG
ncbi:acylphosphatase [Agromyces sp. NPDC049794]|uniref:acylphosphatase n=1 Tax=unclassified Agromyces TaxID=2639701 RepID=UPI0033DA59CF